MKEQEPQEPQLSFEAAAEQLEELVARMESGRQPLASLIADYERGSRLLALCRSQLEQMHRRLEIWEQNAASGGEWKEFSPDGATPSRQGELPL